MHDENILLCSTGIITHFPDFPNHRPIIENRSKIHSDHFELMIYPNWYANIDEIIADFISENITFLVAHADKRIGSLICEFGSREYREALDIFAMNCDIAKQVGADFVVLHLWGLPCSDENFKTNLAALGRCMRIAEGFDIDVTVEPIYCSTRDPLTNFLDITKHYPSCGITMDLRILAYHDQIADLYHCDWIWDRQIKHFHMNDYTGPSFNINGGTHPGLGDIDFDALFQFLALKDFLGTFTLEAASLDENGRIQFQKLNKSLDFVGRYITELNSAIGGSELER